MTIFKKSLLAISIWAATGLAAATTFSVTGVSFTPGAGYGIDASESLTSTLLDVRFSNASFAAQNFNLSNVGDSLLFGIGTVQLAEPNSSQGIVANEQDGLGVTVTFTFALPGNATPFVVTTATATTGSVSDSGVDYVIDWAPITVDFGSSGQYSISLTDLTFNGAGTQTQNATIRLLALDTNTDSDTILLQAPNGLPEPGGMALFGLGLLVLGGLRRNFRR